MPANIRDDFVGNASSPALDGRMSYADLLQSSPYALYRPPAYQPLAARVSGEVIPSKKSKAKIQQDAEQEPQNPLDMHSRALRLNINR